MRKIFILSAAICCMATASFATTHTITAAGMTFTPSSGVTVNMGDTVKWVWGSGTHTTTSVTVPAGAANWSGNLTSSSTSFIYVPTVAGTYDYQCNFHVSMGMIGTFTVIGSAGVTPLAANTSMFNMFPNPASGSVKLRFTQKDQPVSVILTDMSGKTLFSKEYTVSASINIDVKNIPAGMYVVTAKQNGHEYKQQLQITH